MCSSDAKHHAVLLITLLTCTATAACARESHVQNLWPSTPPGQPISLPPEADQTTADDPLVAGRPVIRLGNVSIPQIAVFRPEKKAQNGTAVVICPGGGHHILAYDLEGVEVAQWLNSLGLTAIVLKYRVPARDRQQRWTAAVQDAQRAVSLVRSNSDAWGIASQRIGICGFSAGGETALLTSIFGDQRQYEVQDETDQVSCRPDFAMLIYPGGMIDKDTGRLHDHIEIEKDAPPVFLTHAFDDHVSVQNSLALAERLIQTGVSTELHVYESGGHGYGLRRTEAPITSWPDRAEEWMIRKGFLFPEGE